jgi:hypothetical protein
MLYNLNGKVISFVFSGGECMKKVKHLLIIFILSFAILSVSIFVFINVRANKRVYLSQYDFFEKTYAFQLSFNDEEAEVLKKELDKFIYEDDKIIAFTGEGSVYKLYSSQALIRLAKLLGENEVISVLKNNILESLDDIDFASLNLLDLYHYLLLIKEFEFTDTLEKCEAALRKHYDAETQLLFINSKNDFMNDKLMISFLLYNDLHDFIDLEEFSFISVFQSYYSQAQFLGPKSGNTLYNAGGDILYILSELDYDLIDKEAHRNWFEEWEEHFRNYTFSSPFLIKIYGDYLKIKRIFADVDEDYEKMNSYFETLKIDDFDDFDDYLVVYNILENVDLQRNEAIKNAMKEKLRQEAAGFTFSIKEISIENTFYGIMLLQALGIELKTAKINNLLALYYQEIDQKFKNRDFPTGAKGLYHVLMIQKIINEDPPIDLELVEGYMEMFFKQLRKDDADFQNLLVCRYFVEIYSNLQLGLKNKHKNKINALMNKFIEDHEGKLWFSGITDLFIISKLLKLDAIADELVFEAERKLSQDGGIMDYLGGTPNIYGTYGFLRIYDLYDSEAIFNDWLLEMLSEKRSYVSKIASENGLCPETENGAVTLKSIYCGAIIKNSIWKGGGK